MEWGWGWGWPTLSLLPKVPAQSVHRSRCVFGRRTENMMHTRRDACIGWRSAYPCRGHYLRQEHLISRCSLFLFISTTCMFQAGAAPAVVLGGRFTFASHFALALLRFLVVGFLFSHFPASGRAPHFQIPKAVQPQLQPVLLAGPHR
jgi:hypothetical protein